MGLQTQPLAALARRIVAANTTPVSPFVAAVQRGLARAKNEGIVVYRTADANRLGVAAIKNDVWSEKPYILTVHGPRYRDLTCNCLAGQSGTLCKHVAVGMLARKHGVYAIRPQVAPVIPFRRVDLSNSRMETSVPDPLARLFA